MAYSNSFKAFTVFCVVIITAFTLVNGDNKTTTVAPITDPTTTTAKTTTVPSSTTTTVPSTTTTSKPDTTTKAPEPPSNWNEATENNYTITGTSNKTSFICFMGEFKTSLNVAYKSTNNQTLIAVIGLNSSSSVDASSSKCAENETTLVIMIDGLKDSKLVLKFVNQSGKYAIRDIGLQLTPKSFQSLIVNASSYGLIKANISNGDLFNTSLSNSYLCKANITRPMLVDNRDYNVSLSMSHVHLDAFRNKDDGHVFRKADECESDQTFSDFVPIAVGIALAALVIIVLIAYFIGRRRSRQTSYQSV